MINYDIHPTSVYGWAVTLTVAEEGMNHSDHRAILVTLKALTLIHVTPVPHSSNMVIRPVANFVDEGPLSELDLLLSHVLDSSTSQVGTITSLYGTMHKNTAARSVYTNRSCLYPYPTSASRIWHLLEQKFGYPTRYCANPT